MMDMVDGFCSEYGYELTSEQKEAVASDTKATLLLAVPGSGKTTVLLARIGFQVKVLGIPEERILAVTYTRKAAEEMKIRYESRFGRSRVVFKTINALSLEIYRTFCKVQKHPERTLITREQSRRLVGRIIRKVENRVANVSDYERLQAQIAFIKNMMYTTEEEINGNLDPENGYLYEEYRLYSKAMDHPYEMNVGNVGVDTRLMDYDDQMVNAYWILTHSRSLLDHFCRKYRYIDVDEAQDNSKIQHEIIRMLSLRAENMFMVGDDDQSIYGFRAAYPEILLNFRKVYPESVILHLSRNFRSDGCIVALADRFIGNNKVREEKRMVSHKPSRQKVTLISSPDRHTQYRMALSNAVREGKGTAILYRDNESSVLLAYYLMKRGIEFTLRTPEANFFDFIQVQEMLSYLKLAENPYDMESFRMIARKGIVYPTRTEEEEMALVMRQEGCDVFDALDSVSSYKGKYFREDMEILKYLDSSSSIDHIMDSGYRMHIERNELSNYRMETLHFLAEDIPDRHEFLSVVDTLRDSFRSDITSREEGALTLSTVHSAKGLEWENVHYIDLSDVCYPEPDDTSNPFLSEEYRRVFYVGITRAKRHLTLYRYAGEEFSLLELLRTGR